MIFKAKLLCLVIFLFHPVLMVASTPEATGDEPLVSFDKKPSLFFIYDRNFSFVEGKLASTTGIKAGLEFNKKLKLGLGYGWLNTDIVEKKTITTMLGADSTLNAKFTLRMGIIYGEYMIRDKGMWQFSVPAQLGIGTSYFSYYERIGDLNEKKKLDKEGVVMFSATGMATYRIVKWFGISGGVGFRVMLVDNDSLQQNLNGPVFALRVRIFFGEIYKSFFPNGIGADATNE